MALIECVECGTGVSLTAKACPNCGSTKPFKGVKLSPKEQKGMTGKDRRAFTKAGGKLRLSAFGKVLLVLKTFFILFGCLIMYGIYKDIQSPEFQAKVELEKAEYAPMNACRRRLEKLLHVPDSVEYVNEKKVSVGTDKWSVLLTYKAQNKLGVLVKGRAQCDVVRSDGQFKVTGINTN